MLWNPLLVFYPLNSGRRHSPNTTEDSYYWEANSRSVRQTTHPPFTKPDGYETLKFSHHDPEDEGTKIFETPGSTYLTSQSNVPEDFYQQTERLEPWLQKSGTEPKPVHILTTHFFNIYLLLKLLIYGLFNDIINKSYCTASNNRITTKHVQEAVVASNDFLCFRHLTERDKEN